MSGRPSLDGYMMSLAICASMRATCLRRRVGCVLADERGRVLSVGYNGVASGQPHCNHPSKVEVVGSFGERTHSSVRQERTVTRYLHACRGHDLPAGQDGCEAVHAEQNALLQCANADAIFCAYVTLSPCRACAKLLMNTPCKRIVFLEEHSDVSAAVTWKKLGRAWEKFEPSTGALT